MIVQLTLSCGTVVRLPEEYRVFTQDRSGNRREVSSDIQGRLNSITWGILDGRVLMAYEPEDGLAAPPRLVINLTQVTKAAPR